MVRVGINGFGRVGRQVLRQAVGRDDVQVVMVNSPSDLEIYCHLLRRDSTYGAFPLPVERVDNGLRVGDDEITFTHEEEPGSIPWADAQIDVVVESSGRFREGGVARRHIRDGGPYKVLISGPAQESDITVVLGINEDLYDPREHDVISNASCTTNCLAPVIRVMDDSFGVRSGLMNTIHSYTTDQRLLDSSHRDPRRARAAAANIVPTTTGAAVAVGEVLPSLKGKIDGFAVRVPTTTVSLLDLTLNLQEAVTEAGIEEAMRAAAAGHLKGILAVSDDPVVSSDFRGCEYSAVVDLPLTRVVGDTLVRVVAWYDNEMGYATRVVDLIRYVAARGL